MTAAAAGDSGPMSPFGPSSSSPAVSPFGAAGGGGIARKPFAEPAGLRPDLPPAEIKQEPWWTKITLVQIVSGGWGWGWGCSIACVCGCRWRCCNGGLYGKELGC